MATLDAFRYNTQRSILSHVAARTNVRPKLTEVQKEGEAPEIIKVELTWNQFLHLIDHLFEEKK